jgi:predicted AAA+ superfamily ATPase
MKPRKVIAALRAQSNTPRVSIILGARQVGKTTLLHALHDELGGLFLDVDVFENYERVSTFERFINTLRIEGYTSGGEQPFFVFLDEFQRYPDLARVFKNVYDHHPRVKIYATGSSSLAVKDAVQESLAGRKTITNLYPLSFEEFLVFKERQDLIPRLAALPALTAKDYGVLVPEAMALLREFLVWGGYPEVALTHERKRREVLASIFDLFLKRDLVAYLKIEKLRNAKILLEQLAINHGAAANYSAYGQVADLDTKTVKSYLDILRETFIVVTLTPHFRNKNREIAKAPRVYFVDPGARNYFVNNFNGLDLRDDAGGLFEGFVLSEILKAGESPDSLHYYRSKDGKEVDLIVDRMSRIWPIEIKHKRRLKAGDLLGLRHFMEKYDIPRAHVVSLGELERQGPVEKVDCFNVGRLLEPADRSE